jgi:hypothetical protein
MLSNASPLLQIKARIIFSLLLAASGRSLVFAAEFAFPWLLV